MGRLVCIIDAEYPARQEFPAQALQLNIVRRFKGESPAITRGGPMNSRSLRVPRQTSRRLRTSSP